jgi:hypothetical protein
MALESLRAAERKRVRRALPTLDQLTVATLTPKIFDGELDSVLVEGVHEGMYLPSS